MSNSVIEPTSQKQFYRSGFTIALSSTVCQCFWAHLPRPSHYRPGALSRRPHTPPHPHTSPRAPPSRRSPFTLPFSRKGRQKGAQSLHGYPLFSKAGQNRPSSRAGWRTQSSATVSEREPTAPHIVPAAPRETYCQASTQVERKHLRLPSAWIWGKHCAILRPVQA